MPKRKATRDILPEGAPVLAATDRLLAEREWAARHPNEWSQWVRLLPLLRVGATPFDFRRFLTELGVRPSAAHVVGRKDRARPYEQGNLAWRLRPAKKKGKYLTYREVGAEFGIRKSALYRLKDKGLVEWSKPPGSSYLFSRASLEAVLKEYGQVPRGRPTPPATPAPPKRRPRKVVPTGGLRFIRLPASRPPSA